MAWSPGKKLHKLSPKIFADPTFLQSLNWVRIQARYTYMIYKSHTFPYPDLLGYSAPEEIYFAPALLR